MMEIFPHSTLVAQVSDPYTPETPPPPPGFIVSIISSFQVVISDFFFGLIFFNSIWSNAMYNSDSHKGSLKMA